MRKEAAVKLYAIHSIKATVTFSKTFKLVLDKQKANKSNRVLLLFFLADWYIAK